MNDTDTIEIPEHLPVAPLESVVISENGTRVTAFGRDYPLKPDIDGDLRPELSVWPYILTHKRKE